MTSVSVGRIRALPTAAAEGAQAGGGVRLPRLRGQLVRFATIGAASTVVNLGLLAMLHHPLGSQLGNAVALLVATVLNTAANRWWTFGVRGSDGLGRHHLQSLTIFVITWACSSGALALLSLRLPGASTTLTVAVVAAANVVSTVIRFVAMSRWIFRPHVAAP